MENIEENKFTYYAFVSHSHRDAKWANWIWKALEHYRLPSNVRKAVPRPLPKKLQPVFLDKADLGSGKLVDGLYKELKASRYLIVLCSPDSAQPNAEGKHFVETEVQHFIDLGRSDRIIPVIVSGTYPTVYCPALKKLNPKGIDAVTTPRPRVLNDVVAAILGLRPDELWQRWERQQRIKHIWQSILGVAATIALATVGLFVWEDRRDVEINYADYVEAYGLPQGLFKLTDEDVSHRHVHYCFKYHGLKYWPNSVHKDTSGNNPFKFLGFKRVLRRVDQANSVGRPINLDHFELGDRPQIQIFDRYDSDGTLSKMHQATFMGDGVEEKLVKTTSYKQNNGVANNIAEFSSKNLLKPLFVQTVGEHIVNGKLELKISGIAKNSIIRDGRGYAQTVMFYNVAGERLCNADGVGGFRFERDKFGRIVKRIYLNDSGKDCADKNGVAMQAYKYEGRVLTEVYYLDIKEKPIRNASKWAHRVDFYDDWQNLRQSVFYDEHGMRTVANEGYAEVRKTYNCHGKIVLESYFDIEGHPCLFDNGYAEVRCAYDLFGNKKSQYYYDVDGKLCSCLSDSIAGWRADYDDRGLVIRKVFIGSNEKPCEPLICYMGAGFTEYRCTYDLRGNTTSVRYYDAKGNPCFAQYWDESGTAGWRAEYNAQDQEICRVWIDKEGKPCCRKDGYAEEKICYNNGNMTSIHYFDSYGQPCCRRGSEGVLDSAGWWAEYDDCGREIRKVWIGVDGKPSQNENTECSEYRVTYDKHGNKESVRYYDINGNLCLSDYWNRGWNGFDEGKTAGWLAEYDGFGRETRRIWLGIDDKRCLIPEGFAECRITYNSCGLIVRFFGVDSKACGSVVKVNAHSSGSF